MPKISRGKKRNTERSGKDVNKPSKKSRRDEKQNENERCTTAGENCSKDKVEQEETCTLKDIDIDKELDRNASKSNLSVFNVKSIIHHVLSDERVIAMACNAAEEDEIVEEEPDESKVSLSKFEPKLTRSRFREVAQSTGTADPLVFVKETIIQSPLKKVVSPLKTTNNLPDEAPLSPNEDEDIPKLPLVDINFSEEVGSSDEEYDPLKEELEGSEEDSESYLSNTSDLTSPEPLRRTSRFKRRLIPDKAPVPQQIYPNKDSEKTKSKGENEKLVTPFKVPYPILKKTEDEKEKEKADLIARRTRSRLPLTDTSIESLEANFVPPDLSPDLYDLINLEELDSEDIDWQKWLFGLNADKEVTPDTEDPEDSEYNFMADDQKEEQEEYRNDRAVKVSQKELTELFQEFLNEFDDELDEAEGGDSWSQSTASGSSASKDQITRHQRHCLIGQLQQHTQLLVQIYLLAREHPSLHGEAMTCHSLVTELLQLGETASNANVYRLLENQNTPPSVFSFVGLTEAARIVNLPLVTSSVPAVKKRASTPSHPSSLDCDGAGDTSSEKEPPVPREMAEILSSSPVFVYSGLLPHCGFRPQQTKRRGLKFLQAEDNLLVLGIAEHGNDWSQIQRNYLPTKTAKQIKIRRKNLCSTRAPDNVVKQYKKTGKVPYLPVVLSFKGRLGLSQFERRPGNV